MIFNFPNGHSVASTIDFACCVQNATGTEKEYPSSSKYSILARMQCNTKYNALKRTHSTGYTQ